MACCKTFREKGKIPWKFYKQTRNPPEYETLNPARGGIWTAEERYLHTPRPLAGRKNRAAAKIIFATALGVAWRKLKSPEFRRGDENRPQPRILASARLNGMHPPLGPMPGILPCTCVLPKAWGHCGQLCFFAGRRMSCQPETSHWPYLLYPTATTVPSDFRPTV